MLLLKIVCQGLTISGAIMLLTALFSGGGAMMASFDRIQRSPGHVSANTGSLLLLALICSVLGALFLIMAKRLAKCQLQDNE